MPGLKDLVFRLHEGGVEFVLIGGFGAMAHGSSLITRDVDIACRMDPEKLPRLFTAFGAPRSKASPGGAAAKKNQ